MSKIYGSPLFLSGSGGANKDLPPLLDNFKAVTGEEENTILVSADKMEESRAEQLAGAVWVYGDHSPANVNDGTKIQLTREECVRADIPPAPAAITFADIPVSDSGTETIVNLKESDGQLHPYIYLSTNYWGVDGALVLRKDIHSLMKNKNALWPDSPIKTWCNSTFYNELPFKQQILPVTLEGQGFTSSQNYVFVLTATELGDSTVGSGVSDGSKIPYFSTQSRRISNYNEYPTSYWLRTTSAGNPYAVSQSGVIGVDNNPSVANFDVRPAFVLPKDFSLNPTPNEDGSYDMYEEFSAVSALSSSEIVVQKSIPWSKTKDFYARQFTYNSKKQYQTMLEGALASVIVEGAPAQVTDLVVTGSGGTATLTWVNPVDDPVYAETVVVQKVGSAPSDITDGTEIYRGTDQTCTATGLEQSTDYYFAVYTLNSLGIYGQPVVSDVYRYDFPSEPTEWSEVTRINKSQEYIFPETGWFKIVAVAGSGNGAKFVKITDWENYKGYSASGGSGGSGGIAVSKVATQTHDKINITITNKNISIPTLSMSATAGGNSNPVTSGGTTSRGGSAGKAEGGNIENINGKVGNAGTTRENDPPSSTTHLSGGTPVATSYDTYTTKSGEGGSFFGSEWPPSNGSTAYVVILRGNTNTPSPSTASTLSLLPTDSTLTVDWENSGDPVQTGTMLVYNTNHVPTSANDGVSVDIPVAQAAAATFAVDGEEQQADNKKQSYTITGLSNDKPVYVALFPYDANQKYGIPKTDVEIPREHSWYDTQQELQAEVATVKAEMADYQQYYVTTQEVLK